MGLQYMTPHLIGPSNLITGYFGVKKVRIDSQEYTLSHKIIYLLRSFRFDYNLQIKLNSQLVLLFWFAH